MSNFDICIGGEAFMSDLEIVASKATDRLYVQAMTFEGDAAGKQLIDVMLKSPAQDKKLLVDCFSKAVISDDFIWSFRFIKDATFREEIKHTRRLLKQAEEAGISIKWTNPLGLCMWRYPLRNHKKIVIADDQVYLGGINFSDHNFSWADMMVRMTNPDLANALSADIHLTEKNINQSCSSPMDCGDLILLNGVKSKKIYTVVFDKIRSAKQSITVISPYLSGPWMDALKDAASRGINIKIIIPAANNKSLFTGYFLQTAMAYGFELYQKPGMLHLKAMLIDDERLLIGSSNFDVISYYFEQEVMLALTQIAFIQKFKQQVIEPLIQGSEKLNLTKIKATRRGAFLVKALTHFCAFASQSFLTPK